MPKRRVSRHAVIQPINKPYMYIPLTQGQVAIVDAKDFDWLSQWNWYAAWSDKTSGFYAVREQNGRIIRMHREIQKAGKEYEVDHRNHNGLDNRRSNIRTCTSRENTKNKTVKKQGFKGVTWHKKCRKWRADIRNDGVLIYLGLFLTPEEAARVYNKAAKKYHGEFCHLNSIND